MAKKRRPIVKRTRAQLKRQKRLQHFNNSPALAHRRQPTADWDPEAHSAENYKKLGIALDANAAIARSELFKKACRKVPREEPGQKGTMTDFLDKVKNLPPLPKHEVRSMNPQEQFILQDLVRKYGDDYEKMARDTKINIYQCTARQLEKRIKLMQRLFEQAEEAERRAEAEMQAEADAEAEEDAAEDEDIAREVEAELLKDIQNDPEFLQLLGEDQAAMLDGATSLESLQQRLLKQAKRDVVREKRKVEKAIHDALEEKTRGPVEIKASGDTVAITGEKLIEVKGGPNKGSTTYRSGGDLRVQYANGRIYKYIAPKLIRILPSVERQRRKFFKKSTN